MSYDRCFSRLFWVNNQDSDSAAVLHQVRFDYPNYHMFRHGRYLSLLELFLSF